MRGNPRGGTAMLCEGLNDMTRCLIIEGDKTDSARLEDMLSAYGFDLDAVENAADGLELCRYAMPDVIVVSERPAATDAVSFINWRFRGTLSSDWLSPACERGEGTLTCRESNCFGR